jgi:hypothetical protein
VGKRQHLSHKSIDIDIDIEYEQAANDIRFVTMQECARARSSRPKQAVRVEGSVQAGLGAPPLSASARFQKPQFHNRPYVDDGNAIGGSMPPTPSCSFFPFHRPFSILLFCHFQFWLFDVCSPPLSLRSFYRDPFLHDSPARKPIPQLRKSGVLRTTDSQRVFSIGRRIEKKRYKSHDQYSSLHISLSK